MSDSQPSVAALELARSFFGLHAGGRIDTLPHEGRTPRLDGFTVGVWETSAPANHGGELHPDGDELLLILEGAVDIQIYDVPGIDLVPVAAGQAYVVPRGVWHKVLPRGHCKILHMTPGPAIRFRPAAAT